jgi:hypothetical protein
MSDRVSIITPTWGRREKLLKRCMPSVQFQDYDNIEHVIVSDGPDPELAWKIDDAWPPAVCRFPLIIECLPEHSPVPHWGSYARKRGTELATGELICYLDDDDAYRPGHVKALAAALEDPDAMWAYSHMLSHQPSGDVLIGDCEPPVYGQTGSPMLMHRRECLEHAGWGEPDAAEDWKLAQLWLAAALPWKHVAETTIDVYPSAYGHLE